jgi:uncharacterized membrane protein YqhA
MRLPPVCIADLHAARAEYRATSAARRAPSPLPRRGLLLACPIFEPAMPSKPSAPARTPAATERTARRQFALSIVGRAVRLVMLVPILATMLVALGLFAFGAWETWHFLVELYSGMPKAAALLLAIEIVDLFLLATVVQVVSLGLYQLYFDQDIRLPAWLKIETLDDLKAKLVGVVITVLAVYFLGQAVVWTTGIDILFLGGAVALVMVASTWFIARNGK